MRVFVKLCDEDGRKTETFVLACKDVSRAISDLKQEALRKIGSKVEDGEQYRLTLAGNGATLRETDTIEDVLRDGDYLCLCSLYKFTTLVTADKLVSRAGPSQEKGGSGRQVVAAESNYCATLTQRGQIIMECTSCTQLAN